ARSRLLPVSPLFPYTTLFRSDPFVQLLSGRHVLFLSLFLLRQRTIALREPLPLLIYGFSGKSSTQGNFGRFQPGNGGVSRKIFRSEEHTSELQSRFDIVCRLL